LFGSSRRGIGANSRRGEFGSSGGSGDPRTTGGTSARDGGMIRVLCDENLHGEIIKGVLRTLPDLDLVRVQNCSPRSADDPSVLARRVPRNGSLSPMTPGLYHVSPTIG